MKYKKPILIFFILSVLFLSCSKNEVTDPGNIDYQQKIFLTEKGKALVQADNTFGIKLFKNLNEISEGNGNIIISPLSISIALGMTYNGANGETEAAMQNTLELQGLSVEEINQGYKNLIDALTTVDPQVTLNIPNSIWYRNTFSVEQEFIDLNQNYFYAEVNPLDFNDPEAVDIINNWVAVNTNNKIEKILDEIPIEAVMYLINAVYFNATWKYEFDEQYTLPETFYLADGTTKQVDMMKQEATLNYISNNLFEAVDLYYGSSNFSMVVMLPRNGYSPGDIINEMTPENWSDWMTGFGEMNINLSLPKFKLRYDTLLNQVLGNLGMGIAFNPGMADFTGINSNGSLYISFVKHKTYIDVNEEGTEAAAVTIVGIEYTSIGGDTPYQFMVNRPFLFAIKERDTQAIIFLGKVMEPEYEEEE
ncbi:MAG: serpin family protein [Bacteroidales bacterium]|nr:serpin family protein [Bacteroidales bacterium]